MGDVSLLEMRMEGQSLLDSGESSASKYNSRVGRARLANQNARKQKMGVIAFGSHDFAVELPGSCRDSQASQASQACGASEAAAVAEAPALSRRHSEVGEVSSKAAVQVESEAVLGTSPAEVLSILPSTTESGVLWHWNDKAKLLAMTDRTQMLRVLDAKGTLIYKVQLPPEGRTVMLEFEEAGAVLAVVQKLGGAFLWFPSKPEAIQQWEGMSFSSNFKVTKRITRNQHFDTDFACWSEVGKLVLGLTDGNFAVWDLASNQTFMSQKHFAGKLREGITCGAWGPKGEG